MKTSDCILAAENNLLDARRYLESGEAVNWAIDSLGTAILWAMEGWLIARGHEISHGNGWGDTRVIFSKNGPVELRSQLTNLLSETFYLENTLEVDIDDPRPIPSIEEWIAKAFACLEKTEKAVHQLLMDIESDKV